MKSHIELFIATYNKSITLSFCNKNPTKQNRINFQVIDEGVK